MESLSKDRHCVYANFRKYLAISGGIATQPAPFSVVVGRAPCVLTLDGVRHVM